MFGNTTALVGLHVAGKFRDESMMHTCSRHAAWVPRTDGLVFQAHRLLHHSTLGSIVKKKKKRNTLPRFQG